MMFFEERSAPFDRDIVFVHGNLASRRWWYPVMELLSSSAQSGVFSNTQASSFPKGSGKMYAVDLDGHGKTPNPQPGVIHLSDLVEKLVQFIRERKMKSPLIVAHSAGGLVSALAAAKLGDQVGGLILIDPAGPKGLKGVPADIADKYTAMNQDRSLATTIMNLTVYKNNPEDAFFKNELMDDAMTALKNNHVGFVRALEGIDFTSQLENLTVPALVFYGAHDWVVDEESVKDYLPLLKKSEYKKLSENGHCLNYENPSYLCQEILQFLNSCRTPA